MSSALVKDCIDILLKTLSNAFKIVQVKERFLGQGQTITQQKDINSKYELNI